MASSKDYLEYILDQDAEMDLPYEGAKEMLLVDNIENRGVPAGTVRDDVSGVVGTEEEKEVITKLPITLCAVF